MIEHNINILTYNKPEKIIATIGNIGNEIKRVRELRGLTQHDLCKMTKANISAIRNHESGISFPDIRSLIKYAQVLNAEIIFSPKKR